jgi:GABA permease
MIQTSPRRTPSRILVIANETVDSSILAEAIRSCADALAPARVAVAAPALNSRIRHWLSDDDRARKAAEARLDRCLEGLCRAGVDAYGWIADADPLQAIDDALRFFRPDRLIVATHPEERSNWLAHDLVGRARMRFALPVQHVVVGDERATLPAAA